MSLEIKSEKKNLLEARPFEFSSCSEKEIEKLKKWLKDLMDGEAAEQLVFSLQSMLEDINPNHCKDSTREFGKRLATRFGDEESFFDLDKSVKFYDMISQVPLNKIGYYGKSKNDYHSVSLLEFAKPKNNNFSLVFDLNYAYLPGSTKKNGINVLYCSGDRKKMKEVLGNFYGGNWRTEMEFDPESGRYVYVG